MTTCSISNLQKSTTPLADATLQDLIRRFPLPLALFDDAGRLLALNERFVREYGQEALESDLMRTLLSKGTTGWEPIEISAKSGHATGIKAMVWRVRDHSILILDNAADPELLHEVDQLHDRIVQLERLVATDRLTGAWNRTHLDRVVASEMERSLRSQQPVSLILIDIDHFKQINDTFGHQAGDSVLRELVQVVGDTIRSVDLLFRWGGEEFVILAFSTGYRVAVELAEKIRRSVEQHHFEVTGAVTISLGVAEHFGSESADFWFGRLDKALYRAKLEGRNRVCVDRHGNSDAWGARGGLSAMRLIWQEAYECGEPTIDREHRQIFDLANALLDASFGLKTSPTAFTAAFERLYAHLAQHFADEEALLAERGYKDLEAHRRAHVALLTKTSELKASAAAGGTTFGELVDFLANTVVAQHLFTMDRKFFSLFEQ